MPLYKVTHADETRLVKASSASAALRHVTTPLFAVSAITDPSDAAEIAASGVKLESAGEVDIPRDGTPQSEAMREMLAETLGKVGKQPAASVE